MMEIILLVTSFLAATIIGWSLLSIIFYKSSGPGFLQKAALSYGLGMGAVTLQMFLFYFLKIHLSIFNLLLPWVPVIIFSLFIVRRSPPVVIEERCKFSLFEKFLFAGISFEALFAFFRALLKPLESFDSVAIYAIRSKIIYLNGMIPSDFFSRITLNYPNPDHPLLVPLAEVWVYTFLGNLNDLLVKAIFPMYLLSFLIIFFFLLRNFMDRRESLLFTFFLATIPQFNHFATIGYTDFILAYYYSIGACFLYLWLKARGAVRFLVLSAIFSGLAMWTKSEGIVLCIVNLALLGLYFFTNFKKEKFRAVGRIAIFVLIAVLISGPWISLKSSVNLDSEVFEFSTMDLSRFTDIFTKKLGWIRSILYEFQKQFFGPKKWNLVWILFLIILITNFRKSFSNDIKYLSLSIILVMFLYGAVYLLIPTEGPITWYLGTTISRLFIHFVPVTIFWLALMYRKQHFIS